MSDEFAKGYKYGNFVTNNFPYNLPIIRDLERFSINNFHQTIPFTGDPKLTAGYDKGVADMTLALKNKPRQGEKMTAQELMQILAADSISLVEVSIVFLMVSMCSLNSFLIIDCISRALV